eukprot:SAG31_NODE_21726_length_542_cov_1.024831_1_plen_96_part_10
MVYMLARNTALNCASLPRPAKELATVICREKIVISSWPSGAMPILAFLGAPLSFSNVTAVLERAGLDDLIWWLHVAVTVGATVVGTTLLRVMLWWR